MNQEQKLRVTKPTINDTHLRTDMYGTPAPMTSQNANRVDMRHAMVTAKDELYGTCRKHLDLSRPLWWDISFKA